MFDKKRLFVVIVLCEFSLSSVAMEAQELDTTKASPKPKSDKNAKVLPKNVAPRLLSTIQHPHKGNEVNDVNSQFSQIAIQPTKKSEAVWGQWSDSNALNNNFVTGKIKEKHLKIYGSGIVGKDEKLLHELDKSSLLDYEPDLGLASFPHEGPPDESFATEPESISLD